MNLEDVLGDVGAAIGERLEGAGRYEALHLEEARMALAQAWIQLEYADLARSEQR